MTDQERIAALEQRVAVLEACLGDIERKLKLKRRHIQRPPSLELPPPTLPPEPPA